jgi:hypothetical protein
MPDSERARLRRRTAGLRLVRSWTRRAVAGGVVLSAALAAGLAYVLPGQAAHQSATAATSPTATARPSPHATRDDHSARHHSESHKRHRTHHRLTPPSAAPRTSAPATGAQNQGQPPTSGGS